EHARQTQERSDRQINARRDDHERHPERQDAVDRDMEQDGGGVCEREEAGGDEGGDHRHHDERGHDAIPGDPGAGVRDHADRKARAMTASGVRGSASSPWTRPSRMTTARSARAMSSGSSDEITITALPASASARIWR